MPTGFAAGFAVGRALGVAPGVDAQWADVLQRVRATGADAAVFSTDYYILDPVTANVLAFVDWLDPTHLQVQTNPLLQVRPPVPDAHFAGRRSAIFGASQYYTSNRAVSRWRYTADGTGFYGAALFVHSAAQTGVLYGTRRAANQQGAYAYCGAADARNSIGKAGSDILSGGLLVVNLTLGATYLHEFWHATAYSPDASMRAAATTVSQDYVLPAGVADPIDSLTTGAAGDGTFPLNGKMGFWLTAVGHNVGLQAAVQNYARAAYGIAP